MRLGKEDKKKLILAGVLGFFALFAIYYLYDTLFGGTTSTAPPPPVIVSAPAPGGKAAEKIATTSGQLDPTLHMEAMQVTESLVYSGSGRNIFAAGPPPAPPVQKVVAPIAPPRPNLPVIAQGPPPPPPTCPPVCAPINLKFFGTSTSASGVRRAFLLQGDDVFLAAAGDVVQRRYRVVSVAANSIVIEDMPNTNKQTLPLLQN